MTFSAEYYNAARSGNLFFRRALVLYRIRKIIAWRRNHPFDVWACLQLTKGRHA